MIVSQKGISHLIPASVLSMMYELRPATDDDLQFLYELHVATMKEYVDRTWGWDDADQWRRFQVRFNPAGQQVIVAHGRDVGKLVYEQQPTELFLAELEILPEFQGQGIGTEIVEDLIERAVRQRQPLRLRVLKVNRACQLYSRLGFSVADETDTHYRMLFEGDKVIPDGRGEKMLAAMKQDRLHPGQFRLRALLVAIVAISIMFALPRWLGLEYLAFLRSMSGLAFGLAPLGALLAIAICPWELPRRSIPTVAIVCFGMLIAPYLFRLGWTRDSTEVLTTFWATLFTLWLIQFACIFGVWYFEFRRRS